MRPSLPWAWALAAAVAAVAVAASGARAQANLGDDDAPGEPPQAAAPNEAPASPDDDSPSSPPPPADGAPTPRNAVVRSPNSGPAERVLDESQDPSARAPEEDEDDENWGVFWIEAQAGYSFVNLVQFSADNFIPQAEKIEGNGFFGGAALGFRVYFLTLGARATIASYFGFEVGTVGADVAVHLPIPVVSPYVRVGLGYAWMGDANWNDPALSQTEVNGLVVDGGLGLNIKLARLISLGAGFDVAFLNLGRQSARDAGTVGMVNLEESGDAVGLQLRLHAHLTFHI